MHPRVKHERGRAPDGMCAGTCVRQRVRTVRARAGGAPSEAPALALALAATTTAPATLAAVTPATFAAAALATAAASLAAAAHDVHVPFAVRRRRAVLALASVVLNTHTTA